LSSFDEISRYYRLRKFRTYNPRVKVYGKAKASFLYEGDSGYAEYDPDKRQQMNRCEMNNGIMQHFCDLD
ncbi:MAG: hypothetical protein HKN85_04725, partial [Gammaproteobacteria bacterium]|nr:hypothetical protein [Gammaproteobacteria bacterium]